MSSRHLLLRSWRRCCNSASLASGLSAGVEAGTVSTLFLFFTGIVLHDHYHVIHHLFIKKVLMTPIYLKHILAQIHTTEQFLELLDFFPYKYLLILRSGDYIYNRPIYIYNCPILWFNELWCIKYRGWPPCAISSVWQIYMLHASNRVCQINKNPQILRIFGFLFIWQTLSSAFSMYIFQTSDIARWEQPLSIKITSLLRLCINLSFYNGSPESMQE